MPCLSSQFECGSLEFKPSSLHALNSCAFSAHLLGSFEKSGPVVSSAAGPWNQQRAVLMVSAAQHKDRTGRWDWLLSFPSLSFQRELGRGNFWTISQAPTLLCFSPGHRYYFFFALHCERWIAFMGLNNLPVATLVACNIAAPPTLATGLAM